MTDPDHVLIAGDWHGNGEWAMNILDQLHDIITDEPRIVLHVGDFGFWPGRAGELYLRDVHDSLEDADAQLWFVDGNHEDHRRLKELMCARPGGGERDQPYPITPRIWWLPRGYRWEWHGQTWLALGGATSVDRLARTVNRNWWPNEALSVLDVQAAVKGGHADVMVTHDCPEGVAMNLPVPPSWWELEPAQRHRETLRTVVERVQPRTLFHGHYHLHHDSTVHFDYGPASIVGLDCDGALSGNTVLCDVRTMTLTNPFAPGAVWAAGETR